MATTKLVLDQRRIKQDGTYPLLIRVTHQRKILPIQLGVSIPKSDWNSKSSTIKPSCPLYKDIYDLINESEYRIQKAIIALEKRPNSYRVSDIKSLLSSENLKDMSFKQYAERCINQMKVSGRVGNALSYLQALNSICNFSKKELHFSDITYKFLSDYDTFMRSKGTKVNAISCYLRGIRAIFNRAINEDVISIEHYPFRKFRLKTEATPSRAISRENIRKLFSCPLAEGTAKWHYRNYFMLMFCLIGINFADLCTLTKDNIHNGRVIYKRRKTGRIYSILLHPLAIKILDYYQTSDGRYLLPILPNCKLEPMTLKQTLKQKLKQMNKSLNRLARYAFVDEMITTYSSRYSWANIAREIGISKEIIAEALGHSYGNRVTGIYLEGYGDQAMDEANIKVITSILN